MSVEPAHAHAIWSSSGPGDPRGLFCRSLGARPLKDLHGRVLALMAGEQRPADAIRFSAFLAVETYRQDSPLRGTQPRCAGASRRPSGTLRAQRAARAPFYEREQADRDGVELSDPATDGPGKCRGMPRGTRPSDGAAHWSGDKVICENF